jgi:hypothetical protein
LREKYAKQFTGSLKKQPLGERMISIRKGGLQLGARIADTLGGRADIYYDRHSRVLSLSPGDTLLVYKANKEQKTPAQVVSFVGARRVFGITFIGVLEASWNETQLSWDVTLPGDASPASLPEGSRSTGLADGRDLGSKPGEDQSPIERARQVLGVRQYEGDSLGIMNSEVAQNPDVAALPQKDPGSW